MVRESRGGNLIFLLKIREKLGFLYGNADCHENLLFFLWIMENFVHDIHQCEHAYCDSARNS